MGLETKDLRRVTIECFELEGMDEILRFYYDESNNYRKFHYKKGYLNAPINTNFVLGGVVHEEKAKGFDCNYLFTKLKLQKSINEVKFRHIAKGDFTDCLKSKKLYIFLDWLNNTDLYIHYFVMNMFYFSIVDIVDLLAVDSRLEKSFDFVNRIKNALYCIAKIGENQLLNIFARYNYPNINENDFNSFIDDLIEYIKRYENMPEFHIELVCLRQIMKESKTNGKASLLQDKNSKVMINDFSMFYVQPIYMFINSKHIFDDEASVFKLIKEQGLIYNNREIDNYIQSNSKENNLIQISDVVVGLVAKVCDFITATDYNEIEYFIRSMNDIQKRNLELIVKIINKSNNFNEAFLHYSVSRSERKKFFLLGI